jgi:uncharacterized protein (TIGR02449 family)
MDARLTALDEKLSRIAALCEGLRAENASLRVQLTETIRTRDDYGRKLDSARARIESVIKKLPE